MKTISMPKYMLLSLLLFSSFSYAQDSKELPEFNLENKRWFLPADKWDVSDAYVRKGRFFSISKYEISRSPLKIYNSPSRNQSPDILYSGHIEQKSKEINCRFKDVFPNQKFSKTSRCGYFSCIDFGPQIIPSYPPSLRQEWVAFDRKKEKGPCPIKLDVFYSRASEEGYASAYNFTFLEYDSKNKFVTILVNNEKKFLDVSECSDHPIADNGKCEIVNKEKSDYELDWEKLKTIQETESLDSLNVLIKELLPCVKRKDEKCIRKYVEADYPTDKETLEELETCLSYQRLLPHLLGTRGKEKVCVFYTSWSAASRTAGIPKILSVVYPEGVRENSESREVISVPIK